MALVSMRLPETSWISKWKKRSLQSRTFRTDSTFSNSGPPSSGRNRTMFCLLNHDMFSTNGLSYSSSCKSLAIRDPRILASSPPPETPALSHSIFCSPSLTLSTPGTGPCPTYRDMALAVRQSTCMCICRAATCIKTPPITGVTGLNSCSGATWALSLFHALVDRDPRRTRAKWMLDAVIPREQREAKSRRSAGVAITS